MFAGQIDLLTQGVVGSMNDLMIEALQIAAQKGAAQYAEQQYAQRGKGN
jgi:aminoglycoside phosphotransferase